MRIRRVHRCKALGQCLAQGKDSRSVIYCYVLDVEGGTRLIFTANLLVPEVELEAGSLSSKSLCFPTENRDS